MIIHFTEEEVEILDRAVDRINSKPGNRATRSDVLRVGALKHATEILDPEAAQKAAGGSAA